MNSEDTRKFSVLNQKGFTLVEMLVAVAILGILTMLAVPSYQSFQARARQKEGFSHLNVFHAAAQATRAEFGVYPGNLVQTGFQPTGELIYRLRSNDGTDINLPFNDNACWNTEWDCNCGGACPNFKTWQETLGALGRIGVACVECYPCPGLGVLNTSDNSYVIGVSGWISPQATKEDVYYMNEQKQIENCQDGLK